MTLAAKCTRVVHLARTVPRHLPHHPLQGPPSELKGALFLFHTSAASVRCASACDAVATTCADHAPEVNAWAIVRGQRAPRATDSLRAYPPSGCFTSRRVRTMLVRQVRCRRPLCNTYLVPNRSTSSDPQSTQCRTRTFCCTRNQRLASAKISTASVDSIGEG